MLKRDVFVISDSTAITVQTLAQSILSQFSDVKFNITIIPYVDTIEKAKQLVKKVNQSTNERPILFETIINPNLAEIIATANALRFDVLSMYLNPLKAELGIETSAKVGLSHGNTNNEHYKHRINAVNFAMDNDDGIQTQQYNRAELILIGVSRCGKTPTSLYLALQFGIYTANYPITEDDLDNMDLPAPLKPFKHKIFGLTIAPERLTRIRNERRSSSRYASIKQCQTEVNEVEAIYRRYGIPFINTTDYSIEEIAASIIERTGLKRN